MLDNESLCHSPNSGPCMTDVYRYIRAEIVYCQRRYIETHPSDWHGSAKWLERWQALYDVGKVSGMTNLLAPGKRDNRP